MLPSKANHIFPIPVQKADVATKTLLALDTIQALNHLVTKSCIDTGDDQKDRIQRAAQKLGMA